MNNLIQFLQQFGDLIKSDIHLIKQTVSERKLSKGEYFSKPGTVQQQVGFVAEGVMRGFYYDDNGDEITRCFINENSLVVDYINFEAAAPSTEYLQACTDCTLLVFEKHDWEELSKLISGWDSLKSKTVHQCMYQKSRSNPVLAHDAATRYLEFMKNYPSLTNRVPLSYISSFLGVTQQSLSRIRRSVK